jgi:hypothetical protein
VPTLVDLSERLERLVQEGRALEAEGLPFPTEQIRAGVAMAISRGGLEEAATVLKRGESLFTITARDWGWVRETLARADELRELASQLGVDVEHLDSRVGNPRAQLRSAPLTAASLGRAAASASLAVAVLHDAIPKFCVQESQKLGESIRSARNRGEDVGNAVRRFARMVQAMQDHQLVATAHELLEVRKAVARIPRAPAMAVPSEEEEEILMEARNLARRLHRIKAKARNAQSAARLMTQVRAALSEDRRTGTPEEEIEALWDEVDRLTKEHAAESGGLTPAAPPLLSPADDDEPMGPAEDEDGAPAVDDDDLAAPSPRARARSLRRVPP